MFVVRLLELAVLRLYCSNGTNLPFNAFHLEQDVCDMGSVIGS
jgi:hypothetical protein